MNGFVTRREALGAMTGLVCAGGALAAARGSKMRFGFTTYQWARDWDIETLIANATKAQALGVEVRTNNKHKHGIETELTPAQRAEVKKRFKDSPVTIVGLATSIRFDSIDPAVLNQNIAAVADLAKLSHDVGGSGIRVFPNDFHKEVPEEKTIAQIASALNQAGKTAAEYGQLVRIENHGTAGRLTTLRTVMHSVQAKNVRIKLNCDPLDNADGKLRENFDLVRPYLDNTLHMHDLADPAFPYKLQFDLLAGIGWSGWCLMEESIKVPDTCQAYIDQRQLWEKLVPASHRS